MLITDRALSKQLLQSQTPPLFGAAATGYDLRLAVAQGQGQLLRFHDAHRVIPTTQVGSKAPLESSTAREILVLGLDRKNMCFKKYAGEGLSRRKGSRDARAVLELLPPSVITRLVWSVVKGTSGGSERPAYRLLVETAPH